MKKKPARRVTLKVRILALAEEKLALKDIAAQVGTTYSYVSIVLSNARKAGDERAIAHKRTLGGTERVMVLRGMGWADRRIAAELGITTQAVWQQCKKAAARGDPRAFVPRVPSPPSARMIARLAARHEAMERFLGAYEASGFNRSEAARRAGVSLGFAKKVATEAMAVGDPRSPDPKLLTTKEQILQLRVSGLLPYQICDILGLTPSHVGVTLHNARKKGDPRALRCRAPNGTRKKLRAAA